MNSDQNGFFKTLDEIPEKFRCVFSSYPCFNSVQSAVLDHVLKSDNSVVVAAPTGSGKTAVLELAIVKILMDLESAGFENDYKLVYVCPVKALCRERFNDWNPRFRRLGISCVEVTGDGGDYFDLQNCNLIITTPEKWDSLTRKWKDNASLVQMVKLFMIDEVHLLNEDKRGPVLEAIVCRMKTVAKMSKLENLRFLAISATIYNVDDLALWLGTEGKPAVYFKFGNEVRPVQLERIVKGYPLSEKQNPFSFDVQLSYKLMPLIGEYAKGKPTLIFCSTRKSVILTSSAISDTLTFHFTEAQRKSLQDGASLVSDSKLKELVLSGVGYHHAGMSADDRYAIQNLFASGDLPILVATSTLAMGVNLPAHLVIVKSTKQIFAGQATEYSESSILQMIGRAGRPQFDDAATAIIMTEEKMVPKYERLLDSREIVESKLHLHLPEHLNSEIVLYTITDLSVAMEWIRCTFLYVRAFKNPRYYGFDPHGNTCKIEKSLENICLKEINALKKAELIEVSDNGMDVSPTANGKLMSHFYLSFETFKIFLGIDGSAGMPEILQAISEAQEFNEIQLRTNERKTLNELNRNKNRETIRFPLQGKIKNRSMKVNCLIQACLGCLSIQDAALNRESIRIVKIAERLAKCLTECLSKKSRHQSILNAANLNKCLRAKLWENSQFVCRQLDRIGPTLCSLLSSCGKTTFRSIEESNPRDLERILNRAPPFGNVLQDAVRHLPKYGLNMRKIQADGSTYRTSVTVTLLNADVISLKNTAGDRHWLTLIVGDTDNNLLNYTRMTDQILTGKNVEVTVISRSPNLPHKIVADLISDQWVGLDVNGEIPISPNAAAARLFEKTIEAATPAKRRKTTCGQVKNTPKTAKGFDFFKNYSERVQKKAMTCSASLNASGNQSMEPKKAENSNGSKFVACFDFDVPDVDDVDVENPCLRNDQFQVSNLSTPSRNLMEFEESLPCGSFSDVKEDRKTPSPHQQIQRPAFSSLQNIYENLKQTPRTTVFRKNLSFESGYFTES